MFVSACVECRKTCPGCIYGIDTHQTSTSIVVSHTTWRLEHGRATPKYQIFEYYVGAPVCPRPIHFLHSGLYAIQCSRTELFFLIFFLCSLCSDRLCRCHIHVHHGDDHVNACHYLGHGGGHLHRSDWHSLRMGLQRYAVHSSARRQWRCARLWRSWEDHQKCLAKNSSCKGAGCGIWSRCRHLALACWSFQGGGKTFATGSASESD